MMFEEPLKELRRIAFGTAERIVWGLLYTKYRGMPEVMKDALEAYEAQFKNPWSSK